jgi:hypothetical protein
MTSTDQTSSGSKANLVSSSPELLTRPASKPDDRPISSTGELCTSHMSRRREPAQPGACIGCGDESHFLSARANLTYPNHFLTSNRTDLHFTTLQAIRRSGCSACSAYPYEKIRNRVAVGKDSAFRDVSVPSQHFCNIQAVDFAGVSRCLQITQNFSNAEVQPETPSEIVVKKAETALRFAETSQQTLRQISLLPITYIDFAVKNALKLKKLRHLTHTTIVDSNFVARAFRTKPQTHRPRCDVTGRASLCRSSHLSAQTIFQSLRGRKAPRRAIFQTRRIPPWKSASQHFYQIINRYDQITLLAHPIHVQEHPLKNGAFSKINYQITLMGLERRTRSLHGLSRAIKRSKPLIPSLFSE